MIKLINWISSWAEGITITVVIATIIEMILPENNNKKYVKTVIGVYILFAIISPIISAIKGKKYEFNSENYEKYFQNTYQEVSSNIKLNNEKNIEEMYINNLKENITQNLVSKGYKINRISVNIKTNEKDYGTIEKIIIEIEKNEFGQVNIVSINKVEISNSNNENKEKITKLNKSEIENVRKYLSDTYMISEKDIEIN